MKRKANLILMWAAILLALSAWIPLLTADYYLRLSASEMRAEGITEGWVLMINNGRGDQLFFYGFDNDGKFHRVLTRHESEGR